MNPIALFFICYAVAAFLITGVISIFNRILKGTEMDIWLSYDFRSWNIIPVLHMNLKDVKLGDDMYHKAIEMDFIFLCSGVHVILVESDPL